MAGDVSVKIKTLRQNRVAAQCMQALKAKHKRKMFQYTNRSPPPTEPLEYSVTHIVEERTPYNVFKPIEDDIERYLNENKIPFLKTSDNYMPMGCYVVLELHWMDLWRRYALPQSKYADITKY